VQRGTQAAATRSGTQKLPPNFPPATAVSYRADIAAMDPEPYPPQQVKAGAPLFSARCGFCHGRDAAGGENGPDLTRSALVVEDVRGDKIGPIVRSGRVDKGMPPFTLPDPELTAIVAFIHDRKIKADTQQGSRRTVH